jgi:hypothetical protein
LTRRLLKWVLATVLVLLAVPLLAVVVIVILANIDPGRRLIESQTASLTGGMVHIEGLGLTAWPCPSDGGIRGVLRLLARTPLEGLLIHWYVTGRTFARVTGNARMLARIS